MLETITAFDWFGQQVTRPFQRVVLTILTLGAFVSVLFATRRLQERLVERVRPLYVEILTLGVVVVTGVLAAAVTVGLWEQTDEVARLYAGVDLGGPDIARIVLSVLFVLTAFILTRLVRRVIRQLLHSSPAVTDHQEEVTYRLSQVGIWSLTIVVVLGIWIDDLSGLLVGAGLVGAAIGMAARQTIGSVIAGFVLMFARPFEIGDWIEVGDREGTVTDISIFNTRLRSFDGEYVMVPNDLVASSMVTNRSKTGQLRIEVDVGVDYETDVDRAADVLESALADVETRIDDYTRAESTPGPQVVTKGFGDSSIRLGARLWIDDPSPKKRAWVTTAAVRAIQEALAETGIKIPYPQRELSGRAETGGFLLAERTDGGGNRLTTYDESAENGPDDEPSDGNAADESTETATDDGNASTGTANTVQASETGSTPPPEER